MTNYHDSSHRYKPKEDTPIPISSNEWTRDPNPSYICNFCQRRLSKLQNNTGNISYYCVACSVEVDPSLTELRSASKLTTPDGPPDTPLASTKFIEPTVGRKKKELTGSFKVLREKGMRFTSVTESNTKR